MAQWDGNDVWMVVALRVEALGSGSGKNTRMMFMKRSMLTFEDHRDLRLL